MYSYPLARALTDPQFVSLMVCITMISAHITFRNFTKNIIYILLEESKWKVGYKNYNLVVQLEDSQLGNFLVKMSACTKQKKGK